MNRFDIASGQAKAWSILSRSYGAGRVASTYLFYGPEGVGAWALALEFAALLNCEQPRPSEETPGLIFPCHQCRSCRLIGEINFEGLYFAVPIPPLKKGKEAHEEDKSVIGLTAKVLALKRDEPFGLLDRSEPLSVPIDQAREIRRSLSVQGGEGITRVAIFYQMDRMKTQSADALLKLIEEPPANTVIILTAERAEALLPTIQSRSQRIRLERLPEGMIVDYLIQRYEVGETRARLAARISEGRLGRAIRMVTGGEEDDDSNARAIGLMLFKTLVQAPAPVVVSQIHDLINMQDRGGVEDLLRLWQSLIRDCSYYSATGDEEELVNVDFLAEIKQLSPNFVESTAVVRMVDIIKNSLADHALNVHIPPALVAMVLRLKSCLEAPAEAYGREAFDG